MGSVMLSSRMISVLLHYCNGFMFGLIAHPHIDVHARACITLDIKYVTGPDLHALDPLHDLETHVSKQ